VVRLSNHELNYDTASEGEGWGGGKIVLQNIQAFGHIDEDGIKALLSPLREIH
jgi:hypothetical protein